jgi:hypothetical protein
MSIGVSIGLCVGAAIDMMNKNKAKDDEEKKDD